jgi:hypothetical protein
MSSQRHLRSQGPAPALDPINSGDDSDRERIAAGDGEEKAQDENAPTSTGPAAQEAVLRAQLQAAEARAAAAEARAEASELRALLSLRGAAAGPAAGGAGAPQLKLPSQATYSGRVDENLDSWLRDALAMVEFQGLGTGDRAVKWMALYLKDDAQAWWQGGAKAAVATVAELDAALHQRFQPALSAQVARKTVSETKQGGDGVAAYASRFQSAAAKVPGGMGAAEQVFAFTNGLRHALAVEVVKQGCATLQDAIQAAIMQESLARAQAGAGTGSRSKGAASLSALGAGEAEPETGDADEPVTMATLLGAIRAMGPGRGAGRGAGGPGPGPSERPRRLPAEERKRRRENGLCFNCGREGHPARNCTSAFSAGPPGGPGGAGSATRDTAEGQGK